MRLHNRVIKAAFWTDTNLLRHLDRDGRMFYIGLIQLADDSGCLENDILAFKIHLYPADMDVDLDYIQKYRDKLVEMGKLIPYTADGKKCLYLKNFHKHQSLRSPAPPNVPLPDWIEWEPGETARSAGKYIVSKPYGDRTVTVSSCYDDQPEPEPEPEREIELEGSVGETNLPPQPEASVVCDSLPGKNKTTKIREVYNSDFEKFWEFYPRKKEKLRAWRVWKTRIRERVAPGDIINAAENYANVCRGKEEQYIKLAATFLGPDRPYEEYLKGGSGNGRASPAEKDYSLKLGKDTKRERDYTRGLPNEV